MNETKPRPLSSETGRFQIYTAIGESAARPRKKTGGRLTELGFDWVMVVTIGFSAFSIVGIARGIGPVLRAHGL